MTVLVAKECSVTDIMELVSSIVSWATLAEDMAIASESLSVYTAGVAPLSLFRKLVRFQSPSSPISSC